VSECEREKERNGERDGKERASEGEGERAKETESCVPAYACARGSQVSH